MMIPGNTTEYISKYGGFCRDCADNNGICPASGLPCESEISDKAINHVLSAYVYGVSHDFIPPLARNDLARLSEDESAALGKLSEKKGTLTLAQTLDDILGITETLSSRGDMLSGDYLALREAGMELANAASYTCNEYDGTHRLLLAIGKWYTALAGVGGRAQRHAEENV